MPAYERESQQRNSHNISELGPKLFTVINCSGHHTILRRIAVSLIAANTRRNTEQSTSILSMLMDDDHCSLDSIPKNQPYRMMRIPCPRKLFEFGRFINEITRFSWNVLQLKRKHKYV